MTEQELAAMEAGKNSRSKPSAKAESRSQQSAPSIDTDLTADFQAGEELANAKIKAFHDGFTSRLAKGTQFLNTVFNSSSIEIESAQYTRALAPQEEVEASFFDLLYGAKPQPQLEASAND